MTSSLELLELANLEQTKKCEAECCTRNWLNEKKSCFVYSNQPILDEHQTEFGITLLTVSDRVIYLANLLSKFTSFILVLY